MKAGDLDQRVTIQRSTATSDGMGGQVLTWATAQELWANVKSVKGREIDHFGRLVTVETYLVIVRYGHTITTVDRIVWGQKTMNILSAQDRDGDRRWLTILAETGIGT